MHLGKSVTLTAAVLGVTGLIAAADVDSMDLKRAARLTERGFAALQAGNAGRASELYEKALKILPTYPDANLGLGHIAIAERGFDQALKRYEKAKAGYLEMGDALFRVRLRKYNQAQADISRHRDRIASLRSIFSRREQAERSSNQRNIGATTSQIRAEILQTEKLIEQLRAIQPPSHDDGDPIPGEIDFYIGNALLNLGRPEDAIASWRRCAKKSPEFPLVQHNLAVAYWQLRRFDDALGYLERAERLGFQGPPEFKADLERSIRERDATTQATAAP